MGYIEQAGFNRQSAGEIVELMQQMVCRYMKLGISHRNLKFYIPGYFFDELEYSHSRDLLNGVSMRNGQLNVWGTEVHVGYENKVILFCPHPTPSTQSPVIEISRFGLSGMQIVNRQQ